MTVCHKKRGGRCVMPTETFFNLPKEKQKRILDAAAQEFSRVGLSEASIAKVIKEAAISRGSFYQYFTDKEDLYYFYFRTLRSDNHRYLIQAIAEREGDLFAGMEDYFFRLIPEIFTGENQQFYRHLFMNMDAHGFQRVIPYLEKKVDHAHFHQKEHMKRNQEDLMRVVNMDLLDVNDQNELQVLFKMLMHTVFSTIQEGYRYQKLYPNEGQERMEKNFMTKIKWLKNGARKEQKYD